MSASNLGRLIGRGIRSRPQKMKRKGSFASKGPKTQMSLAKAAQTIQFEMNKTGAPDAVAKCPKCPEWFPSVKTRNEHRALLHKK